MYHLRRYFFVISVLNGYRVWWLWSDIGVLRRGERVFCLLDWNSVYCSWFFIWKRSISGSAPKIGWKFTYFGLETHQKIQEELTCPTYPTSLPRVSSMEVKTTACEGLFRGGHWSKNTLTLEQHILEPQNALAQDDDFKTFVCCRWWQIWWQVLRRRESLPQRLQKSMKRYSHCIDYFLMNL